MQFNSDADSQDLVSLMNDLSQSDNNLFPLAQKARMANMALRTIWPWIFNAYGGWQYDDGNQTNLPSATQTITSGTSVYALPTGAITVIGIEVKDSNGNWHKLIPITIEEIQAQGPEGEFMTTSGMPQYYRMVGETIKIYPASNWTQTLSFKVFFDRGISSFVSTDTTKEPGIATEFHDRVAIGASYFFSTVNGKSNMGHLAGLWQQAEKEIKSFYSQRLKERNPARMMVKDIIREYM